MLGKKKRPSLSVITRNHDEKGVRCFRSMCIPNLTGLMPSFKSGIGLPSPSKTRPEILAMVFCAELSQMKAKVSAIITTIIVK